MPYPLVLPRLLREKARSEVLRPDLSLLTLELRLRPFRFLYPWQDKGKPVRGQKNNKEELLTSRLLIASLKTTTNNKPPNCRLVTVVVVRDRGRH